MNTHKQTQKFNNQSCERKIQVSLVMWPLYKSFIIIIDISVISE